MEVKGIASVWDSEKLNRALLRGIKVSQGPNEAQTWRSGWIVVSTGEVWNVGYPVGPLGGQMHYAR